MELLIAVAISLVVSLAMVTLMANTMSTGTQTVRTSKLMQEMRTAMQIMTRELRRANHDPATLDCYDDTECAVLETNSLNTSGGCLTIGYVPAGSRSFCLADGVITMSDGTNSVAITNPDVITVNELAMNCYSGAAGLDEEVSLVLRAQLVNQYRDLPVVEHRLEDRVYPRNLVLTEGCSWVLIDE
jgi:Tfp pilus assembly protein PilW